MNSSCCIGKYRSRIPKQMVDLPHTFRCLHRSCYNVFAVALIQLAISYGVSDLGHTGVAAYPSEHRRAVTGHGTQPSIFSKPSGRGHFLRSMPANSAPHSLYYFQGDENLRYFTPLVSGTANRTERYAHSVTDCRHDGWIFQIVLLS